VSAGPPPETVEFGAFGATPETIKEHVKNVLIIFILKFIY